MFDTTPSKRDAAERAADPLSDAYVYRLRRDDQLNDQPIVMDDVPVPSELRTETRIPATGGPQETSGARTSPACSRPMAGSTRWPSICPAVEQAITTVSGRAFVSSVSGTVSSASGSPKANATEACGTPSRSASGVDQPSAALHVAVIVCT